MATFSGNDVVVSGSLIASGSGNIMQVPRWDYNQVGAFSYPPVGSIMEIVNLPTGGTALYYSTGTSFYKVDLT
jgi:hypothetical protein